MTGTTASAPEFVTVGEVLGAFGSRGLVKVRPLTDFPERLAELESVRLHRPGPLGARVETRRVVSREQHGDGLFVFEFEGVTTREHAVAMRGFRLEITATEVRPLPPGRFYRFQLVGLEVRDEVGRLLGKVRDILETGANDVYVVGGEGASGVGDELLLPALKEVVLKIDPQAGVMVVRPLRTWDER